LESGYDGTRRNRLHAARAAVFALPGRNALQRQKSGIAETLPEAGKKQELVEVNLVALVLANPEGETLLLPPPKVKNPNSIPDHIPTLVANLWHFPTVSATGVPLDAARDVWKKINRGLEFPEESKPLQMVRHAVTFRKVTVNGFLVPVAKLPKVKGRRDPGFA